MDNTYQPTGGDPQDRQPTEQFWPMPSVPARPQEPPDASQHFARDRRKALHWTVGVTVAAILAGGGIIAGVAMSGNAATAGSTGAGPAGQAAMLNATLSSADTPGAPAPAPTSAGTGNSSTAAATACAKAAASARAAGHPRAALALAGHCRSFRLRVARLIGGIDGQFTFQTKKGPRTLAYERGVIETVSSGSNIVVRASDGTTWTWDLVSNTVVREKGAKTAETSLAAGQAVWVGGPVNSGTKDARLIVIRPPASSPSASPSASPSS
jgi:hypothetical protein